MVVYSYFEYGKDIEERGKFLLGCFIFEKDFKGVCFLILGIY